MLLNNNIRQTFATIVCFYGKLGYNPNTLNNRIHTYFLAHQWQDQDLKAKLRTNSDKELSYNSWMSMIKNTSQLDADYKQYALKNPLKATKSVKNLSVFATWSLYGEGMSLSQYNAVAVFDTQTKKFVRLPENDQFSVTGQMGSHRTSLSNLDCNAEGSSKLFGFQMDVSNSTKIRFQPSTFRHMNQKTLNLDVPWTSNQMVDWFMCGKSVPATNQKLRQKDQKYSGQEKLIEDLSNTDIYLKKNQSRYSHQTKMSTIAGFFTNSQTKDQNSDIKILNSPSLQHWRTITMNFPDSSDPMNPGKFKKVNIYIKQIDGGILVDLGSAAVDLNDLNALPIYGKYQLSIKQGSISLSESNSMKEVYKNQGGLTFIPTKEILKNQEIVVNFTINFQVQGFKKYDFQGKQAKYTVEILDPVVKNNLKEDWTKYVSYYENLAELPLICYSYGKPLNSSVEISLETNYEIDDGAVRDYQCLKTVKDNLENMLQNDAVMKQRYKSFEKIQADVYQGQLEMVNSVSKEILKNLKYDQKGENPYWVYKDTNDKIKIQFQKNKKDTCLVEFKDGLATLKIELDKQLTSENNPRRPVMPNVTVNGSLKIKDLTGVDSNQFYILFYDSKQCKRINSVDWINDVGPILRVNGLLYPMMQKIADLYGFENLSMNAMRRVFDVEDENHPRYMPATREMSRLDHRNIRKWLYNPIFTRNTIGNQTKLGCPGKIPTPELFRDLKKQLIKDLKKAFKLELTTIPLYLSGAYSAPNKKSRLHLLQVAKDQMKHLFIVSNLLNSLEDKSLFPQDVKTVPYTDQDFIPNYPLTPKQLGILISSNPQLNKLLNFDIKPYTLNQLLVFIFIELPGELDLLHIEYIGNKKSIQERIKTMNKLFDYAKEELEKQQSKFLTIGEVYAKIIEQLWLISDIEEYINKDKQFGTQTVTLFTGDPRKQFIYFGLENMIQITDITSALSQLRIIIEQGEGSSLFTKMGNINKESHFMKFISEYTNCDIRVVTSRSSTKDAIARFQLCDRQSPVVQKAENINPEKWTQDNDKDVNKLISQEMKKEREDVFRQPQGSTSPVPPYADIYARPSFTNAYKSLLKELDFIFNVSDSEAQKLYPELTDHHQRHQALKGEKKKRMDDSISKMKQMSMLSRSVMHPIYGLNPQDQFTNQIYGFEVKDDYNMGSRPDFNVKFDKDEKIKTGKGQKKQ